MTSDIKRDSKMNQEEILERIAKKLGVSTAMAKDWMRPQIYESEDKQAAAQWDESKHPRQYDGIN